MILRVFPIVSLSVAFLFVLVTTPIARRFALAIGLMDNLDTHRKLHREPIAICGGIAILFSLLGTRAIGCFCSQFDFTKWPERQFVGVPDRSPTSVLCIIDFS